jgi:NAD(P)-dependent dehydrogenase (short-subunit alcohol dehydrogenase family)
LPGGNGDFQLGLFGGFLVGREAARRLATLGHGKIIFTGASASLGGKPGFAHFAAAKAGVRMIAQSMAREYGPLGSEGLSARLCQPSTLRIVIWPEASKAQNNIAAVFAEGNTVWL